MKKFTFKLQTVLDGRQRVEEQAKIAFAQAQGRVIEAEQEIESLLEQRTQTLNLPSDCAIDARMSAHQYADDLSRRAQETAYRRDEYARVAEMRRRELTRAQADRKAVDKLKEHAWSDYQTELQRVEQNTLDEVASTRHEFSRRAAQQYARNGEVRR